MLRFACIACLALLFLNSLSVAQDSSAIQGAELTQTAKETLSGNWVKIAEQTEEEVQKARSNFCDRKVFGDDSQDYIWTYNEQANSTEIPVLKDAKGNLAFRFNGDDDLYAATVSLEMTGLIAILPQYTDIEVRRAGELRMDLNENLLGVTFAHATEISPAIDVFGLVPWVRQSVIVQKTEHAGTGETFMFASFPMGQNYERLDATSFYVKCP